jgi:hypothetical protein
VTTICSNLRDPFCIISDIYTYAHVHIHIYTESHTHTYIHIHTYTHIHTHTFTHTLYLCMLAYPDWTVLRVLRLSHTHTHTHTPTHTHTHTHTHTLLILFSGEDEGQNFQSGSATAGIVCTDTEMPWFYLHLIMCFDCPAGTWNPDSNKAFNSCIPKPSGDSTHLLPL